LCNIATYKHIVGSKAGIILIVGPLIIYAVYAADRIFIIVHAAGMTGHAAQWIIVSVILVLAQSVRLKSTAAT